MGFLSGSGVKNPHKMWEPQEMWGQSLGREDPLEEVMATHSSILAWRISWTDEPGRLQSKWSHRVGHGWSNLAWHSTCLIFYLLIYLLSNISRAIKYSDYKVAAPIFVWYLFLSLSATIPWRGNDVTLN